MLNQEGANTFSNQGIHVIAFRSTLSHASHCTKRSHDDIHTHIQTLYSKPCAHTLIIAPETRMDDK